MVIFLGRDFIRTSWLFQNLGQDGSFLRRYCHIFRTSWQFHNWGRVGHVLRTRWSPFKKFGKLKILGVCILYLLGRRDGVQLLGVNRNTS